MQRSLLNPKRVEGLFSEHYIKDRFPETGRYKKLTPPNEVRKKVEALISEVLKTATTKNEAQLEEDFIQPLLNALSINYIVQVNTPAGTADYAFFASEEDRAAADARADDKYEGAVAIADAKRWGRPLDARGGAELLDKNPNAVPTKQIANYIYETGVNWGVLTDGRLWRLYNRNTTPVSQSFFEINLIDAVEDADAFHLFYALFSGAAFAAEAQEHVLKESEAYWAEIGDDLKDRAYEALAHLCNGFRNARPDLDVKDIYEAAVILLYRLLFVLYGEYKKLLPVAEEGYRRYSLGKILHDVERGDVDTFSESLDTFYGRLKNLFHLIDQGDKSLNVYQYNGGLFKEQGLPFLPPNFLVDNAVPDRYLAKALKLIAYTESKKGRGRHLVDYGELDVRHLGSIYEGLLEFHPKLVDGEIVLETDKGERKATGSYFTPGYIVNYIVENTLGPLTENMTTPEEVLSLKILDPAMGSGHFLVGAVDFIGRQCVKHAGAEAEATEKDYQRQAVERCIYGVDLNPLAVELAKLSLWLHTVAKDKPLSFLDHHLKLGNSLVGARVADLAELPKKGKKKEAAATQNLFATRLEQVMPPALNEVMGILGRGTEVIDDIEFKEASLKSAEERLAPFKALADTWVSTYFGNDVSADDYDAALAALTRPQNLLALPPVAAAVKMSHGDEHRVGREFFHWPLEFPEVFFDDFGREKENPGFDAVIGNPPYGKISKEKTAAYISKRFEVKTADMAAYFLEVGSKESRGYLSFIVPKSIAFYETWKSVRELLNSKFNLHRVGDVGIGFDAVNLEQIILVYGESLKKEVTLDRFEPLKNFLPEKRVIKTAHFPSELICINGTIIFTAVGNLENEIIKKIQKNSVFIGEIAEDIFANINLTEIKRALNREEKYVLDGPFFQKPEPEKKNTIPFIRRDPDLGRYFVIKWYLLEVPSNYNKLSKVTSRRLFIKPVRGNRLVAGVDLEGNFATHHHMISVKFTESCGYKLTFALAIINSKVPSYWLMKTVFSGTTETARELNRPYFSKIPLPLIDFSKTGRVSVTRLSDYYKKAGWNDIILAIKENNTCKSSHDFLAFLAQEMLDMNAAKQRVVREFLGWLDGETQGKLDDFRPKKYQKFWEYAFDAFYKWLRKNHEDFTAADHAKLEEEFEKYKAQVLALTDKIERTDCLIDEVVYILYGLSEEEKNIVDPARPERLKECGFE